MISTGDLGYEGHAIAREMLNLEKIDIGTIFTDCGILIYDKEKQDTHSGGSGCGCVGSVLAGHYMRLFEENAIKNVKAFKDKNNAADGFSFETNIKYKYYYSTRKMEEI